MPFGKSLSYPSVYHNPERDWLPLCSIKSSNCEWLVENAWNERELDFLCQRRYKLTSSLWMPLAPKRLKGGYSEQKSGLWILCNHGGEPCLWADFQWQQSGHAWLLPEPLEQEPPGLCVSHLEHALKLLISAIFISRRPPVLTVFTGGIWLKVAQKAFPEDPDMCGKVWSPNILPGGKAELVNYHRTTPAEWDSVDDTGKPHHELNELMSLRKARDIKRQMGEKRRKKRRFFPSLFGRRSR